ncbi:MAG: chemotaxis protein CheX [Acidobacteria bacterium]|nr:chemotaxis protein CheX [Acidobacteriota bacterium]
MTFEELGFFFASPELDDTQKQAITDTAVCVSFQGPLRGRLVVTVCAGLLPVLTANMLGQDVIPNMAQQYDALGELANVICGNLLPNIACPEALFNVHAPEVLTSNHEGITSYGPSTATAQVGLDIGRADLLLFLFEGEGSEGRC